MPSLMPKSDRDAQAFSAPDGNYIAIIRSVAAFKKGGGVVLNASLFDEDGQPIRSAIFKTAIASAVGFHREDDVTSHRLVAALMPEIADNGGEFDYDQLKWRACKVYAGKPRASKKEDPNGKPQTDIVISDAAPLPSADRQKWHDLAARFADLKWKMPAEAGPGPTGQEPMPSTNVNPFANQPQVQAPRSFTPQPAVANPFAAKPAATAPNPFGTAKPVGNPF